jgi:RimJ/RimL family protein N-acetyltransferase
MYLVRPASLSDLPVIHQLQNIPHRENVFVEALAPLETFLQLSEVGMNTGEEYFYLFEQDSVPLGFIKYQSKDESTTIWGKWLSTLVYVCGVLAFDDLKFSKLIWYTRANNKPMIRTCEKMKFRRTGEKNICNITEGFAFIAVGKLIFFEITSREFNAQRHWMKELSLPVVLRFHGPA